MILTLSGDLDLGGAPGLARAVTVAIEANPTWLVLDLEGITFIDSVGLRQLINARQQATAHGVIVTIRRVPRFMRRVFDLIGAWQWFLVEAKR